MSVPTRIQRLLKSLLTETPDRPMANRGKNDNDVEKLRDAGFDVESLMNVNWSANDAVTFAIDARYHVVMWMANSADERAYQHVDFDDFFTGGYRDAKVSKGVVGMDWKKYRGIAQWHKNAFSSGDRASATLMMGRLWRKTGFVSFWNKKDDVMKEWNLVLDFITNMHLNPKKCAYEFIDRMDIELYDEVEGKTTDKMKNVDPEVLRQMHTSPELKKALLGTATGKTRSAMDGYYSHVGDGVIKLGSLLTEDPDNIEVSIDSDMLSRMKSLGIDADRIVRKKIWHDNNDAIPFTFDITNDVLIFSKLVDSDRERLTHDDIFGTLSVFADNPKLFSLKKLSYGWTITPVDDDGWDDIAGPGLTPGPLTFVGLDSSNDVEHYVNNDAAVLGGPSRGNPRYVFGRIWEKIPIISFWKEMKRVLQPNVMKIVVATLENLGIDPTKTAYEFLDHSDHLFLYSDLSVPNASTMSAAEYKEKLAKQHLDPQAKRDLNKDVEFPNKYGDMLPAQYHAWSRTSDGIIKLGDLLK